MFLLDASSELNLNNKDYLIALETFIWLSYKLDLPKDDVTTENFLNQTLPHVTAHITAKQEGILAGIQEAQWFLQRVGIKFITSKKDGMTLKKDDIVLTIEGRASSILSAERTLLNLIQRMSGVATKTKKMSESLPKEIKLAATRKTLWGPLDKRAVSLGGGITHRLSLSDAILVKENHIALTKNFKKSLESILKRIEEVRFVEIELESEKQVYEFLEIYLPLKKHFKINNDKVVVMLDNFKAPEVGKVIPILKQAGLMVEVSGGINEKTILSYTIKGVDVISSSSITMAAPQIDLSLGIHKK